MGYHYVPRRYLMNFAPAEAPEHVWLHDRQSSQPRLVPIAKTAQSKQYYDDETELLLAQSVETPANIVMTKLLDRSRIDPAERLQMAFYIAVMLRRVPYRRRKTMEMYPDLLDETVASVREEIHQYADSLPAGDSTLVNRWLKELEDAHNKMSAHPSDGVMQAVQDPWPSKKIVDCIYRMQWRIVETSGPQYFICCDNPAFFFGAYGLANSQSEITFPLASTRCLHGCWQTADVSLPYLTARPAFVKEMNRRLASTTERLAFHCEAAPWIHKLLQKENRHMSAIRWQ